MQIHHITLLTGNIPRSIQFYTEILGFRFVKNSVNQEDPTRPMFIMPTMWQLQEQ